MKAIQTTYLVDGQPQTVLVRAADRPLSVQFSDQETLRVLLQLCAPEHARVVDVTHNRGAMWQGVGVQPYRVDIDPELFEQGLIDLAADCRRLPFADKSWDVIVFDPPHLTDTGERTLGHDPQWRARYGLGKHGPSGINIGPLFPTFLAEASRVLSEDGIVLAKISNMVHSGRYQDQARMFKNVAEQLGFTVCSEVIRVAAQRENLIDPKWQQVLHPRTIHTYWIVLRKGERCQARRSA